MEGLARPGRVCAKYSQVHFKSTAGFEDREDSGDLGAGVLTAEVDPVLASEGDRAHGVLGQVG